MSDPLATYLEDHLAGSRVAIDLLENMRDEHPGESLGRFAAEMLADIRDDRAVLEGLVERVGGEASGFVKESMAWLGEKGTRMKLSRRAGEGLGTFEALETVSLGILGKLSLWQALQEVAGVDRRLGALDFPSLVARARDQHGRAEAQRLDAARQVFRGAPE